jgi:ribosomal protein S18 acetylase RimI-like enzyme
MIRRGTLADRQQIVEILADAFADDPVMNWICSRPGYLISTFQMMFDTLAPSEEYYLDDNGLGATLWLRPGEKFESPLTLSAILGMLKFGVKANLRSLRALRVMGEHHPKSPDHYYLFAIGTHSRARGRGIGSTLIQETLQACDRDGEPAYLENSKEQNLGFYQAHGFVARDPVYIQRGSPPLWPMWREPRQG